MRRLVAAVAVTSALLVAGCSSDKTATTAGATPAVSAGAAVSGATTARPDSGAADAALAGDTAAICAQARTTGDNVVVTFTQDQKQLTEAGSAKDKAAVAAAREKATRDVENYAYALLDMSKLVADPTVKKGLAAMNASVTALKGDVTKLDAEEQGRLAGTLAKACGNG